MSSLIRRVPEGRLLAMLRREILPEIRRLGGDRRFTLVFDREGRSPKFFRPSVPSRRL